MLIFGALMNSSLKKTFETHETEHSCCHFPINLVTSDKVTKCLSDFQMNDRRGKK